MALVTLGKVVRALGLKGLLGVAGSEGALATLGQVTLRRAGMADRPAKVLVARPQGRLWALGIEGVTDRTAAEAWVGAEVLAEREDLGEAGEGRFYWTDLEGLPVLTAQGAPVGKVTGLLETGAVDVLVVKGAKGEVLIPLAPYVEVDLQGRRIVVDAPDGLLET